MMESLGWNIEAWMQADLPWWVPVCVAVAVTVIIIADLWPRNREDDDA